MNYKLAANAVALLMCLHVGCSEPVPASRKNPPAVAPQSNVSLSVEAIAMRAVYSKFGVDSPENNTPEYVVKVRVTNNGTTAIEWTETVMAFVPIDGPPLVSKTKFEDENEAGDETAKQQARKFRLEPGKELVREARSNGYTEDLLKASKGAPLQLHIDFVNDGKSLAPRFISDLPELPTLPLEPKGSGSPMQGEKLEFRRRPADAGATGAA